MMGDLHPVRVLIVDDEPLARRRIVELLADDRDTGFVTKQLHNATAGERLVVHDQHANRG